VPGQPDREPNRKKRKEERKHIKQRAAIERV
jgi:hypothetical protein